jgi:hypothetical protein
MKVLVNKFTISVFIKRGGHTWTRPTTFAHRPLLTLGFFFSIDIRLVMLGEISKLNLYCLRKVSAKSFHFLILVLFSLIYQLKADVVRLS